MSEPTTKPSELAEIIEDETKFRLYVVQKLERFSAWQEAHDREDELRFTAGDERMSRIESNLGGAVSGVNTLQGDKKMIQGAWKALSIVVAAALVFAGAFSWLWDRVAVLFAKGTP